MASTKVPCMFSSSRRNRRTFSCSFIILIFRERLAWMALFRLCQNLKARIHHKDFQTILNQIFQTLFRYIFGATSLNFYEASDDSQRPWNFQTYKGDFYKCMHCVLNESWLFRPRGSKTATNHGEPFSVLHFKEDAILGHEAICFKFSHNNVAVTG